MQQSHYRIFYSNFYFGINLLYTVESLGSRQIENEEKQFVKAIHEPLISESLFQQVQLIIKKDCNKRTKKDELKSLFPLRTFMHCPWCGRKMTGSVSKGRWGGRYPYYHCTTYKCKGRFRADKLNNSYEEKLKKLYLRPEVNELFDLVLEDENIFTCQREYTDECKKIKNDISKQELLISKARKYFLDDKIDIDDFNNLKKEHNEILCQLNGELEIIIQKIARCDLNKKMWPDTEFNIFRSYKDQDIKGKRDIISLFTPSSINSASGKINSLKINETLGKLEPNKDCEPLESTFLLSPMHYTPKKNQGLRFFKKIPNTDFTFNSVK